MMLTPEQRSSIVLQNLERNDCGVVAIQAVTGWTREVSMQRVVDAGYDPEIGVSHGMLEKVLVEHGYHVMPAPYDVGETVGTFVMLNEYGTFLVYTVDHVMPLKEGNLYNCQVSHFDRLYAVTRVRR